MIQALYDIETRDKDYSPDQRQQLRTRESSAMLGSIEKWRDSPVVADVLPNSDFAEAVRYIRNHWSALTEHVDDGRLPIDNNEVARLMTQGDWAQSRRRVALASVPGRGLVRGRNSLDYESKGHHEQTISTLPDGD